MKPLIVLIVVFVLSLFVIRMVNGVFDYSLSGRIAMSVMLLFTSLGHFKFTDGMSKMMPERVPFKKELVYITGFIEIAAAIGLLIPSSQKLTGWLLILFFLLILPANINAALKRVDYEKGTYEGPGINYLWFRVPLQIFFIMWVYYFAILHSPRM
jgi:uncharacterized membrane protein